MDKLEVRLDNVPYRVEVDQPPDADGQLAVRVDGEQVSVRVPFSDLTDDYPEWVVINDRPYELGLERDLRHLHSRGHLYQVQVRDLDLAGTRPISGDGRIKAPIPGQVTQVLCQMGQSVEAGQPLVILEAMKMENQIRAPRSGTVAALNVTAGQGVTLDQVLVEIN